MTREEWTKITDLFGNLLDLDSEAQAAFLARLRTDDRAAADEVQSLLEQHLRPGEFLPDFPAPPRPAADLSGRTLGAYRLIRLLGCGGMGSVYLAERSDGAFSKQVAVKLLSPAFAHAPERFHRERELLARLDHPNIARLLDGGTTPEGSPYLVMEYVDGVPIDRYCRDHNLGLDAALALLRQVCDGLAHAHQRLIIHCDIKPENILVTPDGTAKLLDFGIARLVDLGAQTTQFRAVTPAFSSPEQLLGHSLTTASDVYAIGVLGYLVLTGSWPYTLRSAHMAEAVQAVLTIDPVPASRIAGVPRNRARKLRGDLDNVLAKSVAKDPSRRYASAGQLADDLEAFRRGLPVRARPDSPAYRIRRFIGRHRIATVATIAALASLIAAVTMSAWQARVAQRRFDDLREFAHTVVFDVNDALAPIPGTTAARKLVVDTALRYLDRLGEEQSTDLGLREELAAAYIRVGKVQGGAFLPNLGDVKGAASSFRKAVATVGSSPATPALERLRIEAHVNIGLVAADPADGAPEFDRAVAAGERQLARASDDVPTLRLMAQAYHGKATNAHATNHVPDHEEAVRRAIAIRERVLALAPGNSQDQIDLAREYMQRALVCMQRQDAEGALASLRHAQSLLEALRGGTPANQMLIRELAVTRSRAGGVLMEVGRLSDAAAELGLAIDMLQPLVASDVNNRQYLAELATAWVRLGDVRRAEGRPGDALELHRRALDVRRENAKRDSSFMFVPWGLATSLNAVGQDLLELSPPNWLEAGRFFAEARDLVEPLLVRAPGFNQLRREAAISYEGLARVAVANHGRHSAESRAAVEKSVASWREVFVRSVGDRRQFERLTRVEALLASLPRSH